MAYAVANGVKLYYEIEGPDAGVPVVLIHGLASPMNAWPRSMIDELVSAGYRVVRFDNRDVGRSEDMSALGKAGIIKIMLLQSVGFKPKPPYTLQDMASDAIALLSEINIEEFHLVGASMGGMIAQRIAHTCPQRVLSLTSIMSSSGAPKLPEADKEVLDILYSSPGGNDTAKHYEHSKKLWRAIGSKTYALSDPELDEFLTSLTNWGPSNGQGGTRQFAAIFTDRDRYKLLSEIDVPTLVLHGNEDRLVPPICGEDSAKRIPRAKFKLIAGMGHDFPERLVPALCKDLFAHFESAAGLNVTDLEAAR